MSNTDRNYAQAFLTHAGTKRLGVEAAADLSPIEVRRAGVLHLARKAGAYALAATAFIGGSIGAGELLSYSIDHSTTTQYQEQLARQRQEVTGLPPNQAPTPGEQGNLPSGK